MGRNLYGATMDRSAFGERLEMVIGGVMKFKTDGTHLLVRFGFLCALCVLCGYLEI